MIKRRGIRSPASFSMRSLWPFLLSWLVSWLLVCSQTLSAADECREWDIPYAVSSEFPAGYVLYQGEGNPYGFIRPSLYQPSTRRVWHISTQGILVGESLLGITWDGATTHGWNLLPIIMCWDMENSHLRLVVTTWAFAGWVTGAGFLENYPDLEAGGSGDAENLTLEHGFHISSPAVGCPECTGSGPGPDPAVNTNQFHLDVTNALAGISERLDMAQQYRTGGFSDAFATSIGDRLQSKLGELTNALSGQIDSASNLLATAYPAGLGSMSLPPPGSGDLVIPMMGSAGIPLFSWLTSALTPFLTLGAFLRFVITLMLAAWVNYTIQKEVMEAARSVVQSRSQTSNAGGGIPGLSSIVGMTFAAIIVGLALALPSTLSAFGEAQRVAVASEGGDTLGGGDAVLGAAATAVLEAASQIPYVGQLLALVGIFVPFAAIASTMTNWVLYFSLRRVVLLGVQSLIRFFP